MEFVSKVQLRSTYHLQYIDYIVYYVIYFLLNEMYSYIRVTFYCNSDRCRLFLIRVACKRLRVFYYKDVRSGPRRIPNMNDMLAGLEELPESARLLLRPASADNAVPASSPRSEVFATLDGAGHEVHLGDQLVYLVN